MSTIYTISTMYMSIREKVRKVVDAKKATYAKVTEEYMRTREEFLKIEEEADKVIRGESDAYDDVYLPLYYAYIAFKDATYELDYQRKILADNSKVYLI